METNKIKHQKLLDTAEAVLREKFITLSAHIRKEEGSQLNYKETKGSQIKNKEKTEYTDY